MHYQIFIKPEYNIAHRESVSVTEDMTVKSLKRQLVQKFRIPVPMQRLKLENEELFDHDTLLTSGVYPNKVLKLSVNYTKFQRQKNVP